MIDAGNSPKCELRSPPVSGDRALSENGAIAVLIAGRVGSRVSGTDAGGGTSVLLMSGMRRKPLVAISAPEGAAGRPRLVAGRPLPGPHRAARRGRSHRAFRPARTRIDRWAMNNAPPQLHEIVKARRPQQRAATGDDTAADTVRGRERGMRAEGRSIGASPDKEGPSARRGR